MAAALSAASLALLAAASASASASAAPFPVTFSSVVSEGRLTQQEKVLLNHSLSSSSTAASRQHPPSPFSSPSPPLGAALTYFWITGDAEIAYAAIRIYVDGETTPSLAFTPSAAAGVGLVNASEVDHAPWGTPFIGSLGRYSYYTAVRVPFQRSIAVTYQSGAGQADAMVFLAARGAENIALDGIVGGVTLPPTARLRLFTALNVTYKPLDYMVLADIPPSSLAGYSGGAFFLSTLWWSSTSPNTIEGCVRAVDAANGTFPGTLLSSGFEDYYASAWGFISGPFTTALSGVTYWTSPGNLQVGAYRFHSASDPLFFSASAGLRLLLRNGETIDPETGQKCLLESGGAPVGEPGETTLSALGWYYVW
jgi:hypothetical protein